MKKKGLYQLKKSDNKIKEYTLSVLTEDKAGLLNHITIIFNRRKMNINSLNVSNTCPLCLTNSVNIYLNPCGHTCCDDCYGRLLVNNDNKCFLCRSNIMNKNSLYFS